MATLRTSSRDFRAVVAGVVLGALLFASADAPCFAQRVGASIVGEVRDPTGSVVPMVSITITHVPTRLVRQVVTNEAGLYEATPLAVGEYEVAAQASGFKGQIRRGIILETGQRARVDFTLEIGDLAEKVTIEGTAPLVQSETSSLGQVIDNKRIVGLPLNGRSFAALTLLVAGASEANTGQVMFASGVTAGAQVATSVNGIRNEANNYTIDGMAGSYSIFGSADLYPSLDAIQEFKMEVSNFAADQGRTAGAQVNMSYRSGTNAFHGTAFGFLRNNALDARNFFALSQPAKLRQNQYGGVFSGPIVKNKLFFLFNYEGTRQLRAASQTAIVPTERMRSGDFSELRTPISDPLTFDPVTRTRQVFTGNIIPSTRFDSIATKMLQLIPYPLPNRPGQIPNFVDQIPNRFDIDQYASRVDYEISPANHLSATFALNGQTQEQSRATQFPPKSRFQGATHHFVITETHISNPRLVNEFRFGLNLFYSEAVYRVPSVTAEEIGIKGPYSVQPAPIRESRRGLPQVSLTGYALTGESVSGPSRPVTRQFSYIDNVSYSKRSHSLKFGTEISRGHVDFENGSERGGINFSGQFSGDAFADFLLGYPNSASLQIGLTYPRTRSYSLYCYAMDDWKVSPNLTLNLGLRYEYNDPPTELDNKLATFIMGQENGKPKLKKIFAGDSGYDRSLTYTSKKQFAPRFGFAWRPFGRDTTAIRGGYGIFYSNVTWNARFNMAGNTPFFESRTATAPDPFVPILTTAEPFSPRAAIGITPVASGVDPRFLDGNVQQWSLSIQHEFAKSTLLEIGYTGNHGIHWDESRRLNAAPPGEGPVALRRPSPGDPVVGWNDSNGFSYYHGLHAKVEKRSGAFGFLSSYTFGKATDNTSDFSDGAGGRFRDHDHPAIEKGLATMDARHRFVASVLWELPFGPGKRLGKRVPRAAARFIEGWQANWVVLFRSGNPFTPVDSRRLDNGEGFQRRPDRIGNGNLPVSQQSVGRWFNMEAFKVALPFTYGNAGRNILIGPGIANLDLALVKNTRIRENHTLQCRADFFNATNTPHFSNPNADISSVNLFGRITNAGDGRQIQLGLKYTF